MENKLKIAWIAAVIVFALIIPEILFVYIRVNDFLSASQTIIFILIRLITTIAYFFYFRGFILIGINLNNNLMIIGSYLAIALTVIGFGYDLISFSLDGSQEKLVRSTFCIIDGFICIFFGLGLLRIENYFGGTAKWAGILNIIAGGTFAVLILFFIGLILLIPITILEILILYKAANKLDWIPEKAAVA